VILVNSSSGGVDVTLLDVTSLDEGVTSPTVFTRTGCESASIELECCSFDEDRFPSFGYMDWTGRIVDETKREWTPTVFHQEKRSHFQIPRYSNNPLLMPHATRLRVYKGTVRARSCYNYTFQPAGTITQVRYPIST